MDYSHFGGYLVRDYEVALIKIALTAGKVECAGRSCEF
jgi:hypothetical protein